MRASFRRHAPLFLVVGSFSALLAASCGSSDAKKKLEQPTGGEAAGGDERGGSAGRPSAGTSGSGGRGGSAGSAALGGAGNGALNDAGAAGVATVIGDAGATGAAGAGNVQGDAGAAAGGDNGVGAGGMSAIPVGCGDGVKNNAEDCDGTDLVFATCSSKVKSGSGTLACGASCTFDFSGCTCPATWSLCLDPTPACLDTLTDEANCGGCGNVCPGADQCSRGRCVTALGHNITSPTGITVDATNVYFLSAGDTFAYSVPKAGGSAPVAISSVGGGGPDQILEVGTTLYWTNTYGFKVMQVANSGGTGAGFSGTETGSPTGLATNGTSLFWTLDGSPGEVRSATLPAGVASTKVSGAEVVNPKRVAVTASYIVVANAGTSGTNGSVYRYDLNGLNKTLLASGLAPTWGLCVDATNVYFTTNLDNSVWSAPLVAPAPAAALSIAEASPWDIVCDGADLYWVNSGNGQVRTMKKTGGPVTTIAQSGDLSGTGWYLGQPKHLAVDASYVYWTDQGTQSGGGGVFRVSKN